MAACAAPESALFVIRSMFMLPVLAILALGFLAFLVVALPLVPLALVALVFFHGRMLWFGRSRRRQLFRDTMFTLLGTVSAADNNVSRTEIRYCDSVIREHGLSGEGRMRAIECFKRGMAPGFNLDLCLAPFMREYRNDYDMRLLLWGSLLRMAFADDLMSPGEQRVLRRIAARLQMGAVFDQIFTGAGRTHSHRHRRTRSADAAGPGALAAAHSTLGVRHSDDDATIKRAYRRLMSRYHPDKLAHKGLPPEALQAATDRAQEIQRAWDLVSQSRGI